MIDNFGFQLNSLLCGGVELACELQSMEVGLACELKLHALVVEDNIISQMCVNKALEDMGMIADGAENGQEALDKLNVGLSFLRFFCT